MPAVNVTSNYLHPINLDASKLRKKDLHHFADIVELTCLKSIDHETTLEEALDEQLGENEGIGGIVEAEPIPDDEAADSDPAMVNDRHETRMRDILAHLLARQTLFGDAYPFDIDDGFVKLKEEPSKEHKLYAFMLLSSHLCFLPRTDVCKFTSDFEVAAAFALRRFFPNWTLKIVGTAHCAHLQVYAGTPRRKIETFAQDLGLELLIHEEELQRYQTPNGDAGLDVVAWHPFNDGAPHMPVFLAQVGCTDDESQMFSKQYSAYPQRWGHKLRGLAAIGCMVTPQCYRNALNSWPCFTEVDSVFIDRARVLSLLTAAEDFQFDYLQTHQVVESTVS